jgi:hypothetical protein
MTGVFGMSTDIFIRRKNNFVGGAFMTSALNRIKVF